MNITTIHEPPFEPVTLADVYRALRVDVDGSPATHPLDADFERQIVTARRNVEQQTRRSLIRQTVRLSVTDFPSPQWSAFYGTRAYVPKITLPRPPLIYVQSVQYFDADNTLQTVSASDYYVTDDAVPELRFVSAFSAPTVYDRPDAVRVTYVTGYLGDGSPPSAQAEYAEHVPSELKDAILVGVQMLQTSVSPQDYEQWQRMQRSLIHPYIVQIAV